MCTFRTKQTITMPHASDPWSNRNHREESSTELYSLPSPTEVFSVGSKCLHCPGLQNLGGSFPQIICAHFFQGFTNKTKYAPIIIKKSTHNQGTNKMRLPINKLIYTKMIHCFNMDTLNSHGSRLLVGYVPTA